MHWSKTKNRLENAKLAFRKWTTKMLILLAAAIIKRHYTVDRYCALQHDINKPTITAHLLQRLVRQLVLVAYMHFHQQRAVCRKSWQGLVSELLAAVGCVLLQAGTVRGQGGHAVVVNGSAVRDVDLSHILPPGRDFHQEFVVDLLQRQQRFKSVVIQEKCLCFQFFRL